METVMPRDLRILPRLAVVMPLPTELTTPPVTKMNFGMAPHLHRAPPMLRAASPPVNEHLFYEFWSRRGRPTRCPIASPPPRIGAMPCLHPHPRTLSRKRAQS